MRVADRATGTEVDWMYQTAEQKEACKGMVGGKAKWPRGKVCSSACTWEAVPTTTQSVKRLSVTADAGWQLCHQLHGVCSGLQGRADAVQVGPQCLPSGRLRFLGLQARLQGLVLRGCASLL